MKLLRYIPHIVRFLLGFSLVAFGLNMFFNYIPQPKDPLPEAAMAFAGALNASGYMMKLIGVTQLLVGVLLVINRCVPLALVIFAPFMVNSVAFHYFLEPSGMPIAGVFSGLLLYLAWVTRAAYRPLFTTKID